MPEEKSPTSKPKASNSLAQQELDKAEKQFEHFDAEVKSMTMDRMNMAPKEEAEPQTKISTREAQDKPDHYIKPKRTIPSREKFNERFRDDYNFDKEYVKFIAENNEVIGEAVDLWTKPYPGVPAEEWEIPCNKPVWAPRYVAEQIKRKYYHRLTMDHKRNMGADGMAQYYGVMAIDTTIQRLDARPVTNNKSIFMGANGI